MSNEISSPMLEAASAIIYPLKFFNRSSQAQEIIKDNPGTTLDIISLSAAVLLPICMVCNSAEGLVYDESVEGQVRYHCVSCGRRTSWATEKKEAAQLWADYNNPEIPD